MTVSVYIRLLRIYNQRRPPIHGDGRSLNEIENLFTQHASRRWNHKERDISNVRTHMHTHTVNTQTQRTLRKSWFRFAKSLNKTIRQIPLKKWFFSFGKTRTHTHTFVSMENLFSFLFQLTSWFASSNQLLIIFVDFRCWFDFSRILCFVNAGHFASFWKIKFFRSPKTKI